MDFFRVLPKLCRRLDERSVRYALIGGFGMTMLERAERLAIEGGLSLPVAAVEDIIGLKIQAMSNDASRAEQDWLDIRLLVRAAGQLEEHLEHPGRT